MLLSSHIDGNSVISTQVGKASFSIEETINNIAVFLPISCAIIYSLGKEDLLVKTAMYSIAVAIGVTFLQHSFFQFINSNSVNVMVMGVGICLAVGLAIGNYELTKQLVAGGFITGLAATLFSLWALSLLNELMSFVTNMSLVATDTDIYGAGISRVRFDPVVLQNMVAKLDYVRRFLVLLIIIVSLPPALHCLNRFRIRK